MTDTFDWIIKKYAKKFKVHFRVIKAVIWRESNFNPEAISPKGARGLMQVMVDTWNWICKDYIRKDYPYGSCWNIAECNVLIGSRYLRWLYDYFEKYKDKLRDNLQTLVIAAYNCGQGRVKNSGFTVPNIKATQVYVKRVQKAISILKKKEEVR